MSIDEMTKDEVKEIIYKSELLTRELDSLPRLTQAAVIAAMLASWFCKIENLEDRAQSLKSWLEMTCKVMAIIDRSKGGASEHYQVH